MSNSPAVSVNPTVRFGQPQYRGTSTEVIADTYWLGDDVEAKYILTRHELLVVLWFEARHGQPRFRKRWRVWLEQVGPVLWNTSALDPSVVPLPPWRESFGTGDRSVDP